MGTRSLTHVKFDGKTLVTIYGQWDGYPSGMGKDLATFLASKTVGNGIRDEKDRSFANGMHDLAAQLVAHLKAEKPVGSIYLYPDDCGDCGEEYVYTIEGSFGACVPTITCKGEFEKLTAKDALAWIEAHKDE